MSGELQVNTADLRGLAGQQQQIASAIVTAGHTTNGVAKNVAISHGVVCAPSIAALMSANVSRGAAVQAMQAVSNRLATKLEAAAGHYDGTDQQQAAGLDKQMPR